MKSLTELAPKYKIEEDGSIWIESRWHGDPGREDECTGWDKVGEAAYCVEGDGHIATHLVSTYLVAETTLPEPSQSARHMRHKGCSVIRMPCTPEAKSFMYQV